MIKKLLIILTFLILPQVAGATAYYVDFDGGIDGDGLATTTSFNSLDRFTEVARASGDIAFVRRGTATTTQMSHLTFTSDGTSGSPIIITADYDNLWSDFSTSTQTYTLVTGSKTMTASDTITGISANDWVYVAGDCFEHYGASSYNSCDSYKVSSVSGTTLTLAIPYRGDQTGGGNYLRVMPDAPIWSDPTTSDFQWQINTDNFWIIDGISVAQSETNSVADSFVITNSFGIVIRNCILSELTGTGSTNNPLQLSTAASVRIEKTEITGTAGDVPIASTATYGKLEIIYSLISHNGLANEEIIDSTVANGLQILIKDSEINSSGNKHYLFSNQINNSEILIQNVVLSNFVIPILSVSVQKELPFGLFVEDNDANLSYARKQVLSTTTVMEVATTTIRSGGGATSILVTPTDALGPNSPFGSLPLFEYPIYTDTSSKQYDIYFMSTSTTEWTSNPLASELWIECDYYIHTSGNAIKKLKKSTGTINFNASTDWQSLSVTCQPSFAGILYLRGYYAKPLESGKSNQFFIDGTPIIQ